MEVWAQHGVEELTEREAEERAEPGAGPGPAVARSLAYLQTIG